MEDALACDEAIHVVYRVWLRVDRTPAHPVGDGLGSTTWSLDSRRSPSTTTAWL